MTSRVCLTLSVTGASHKVSVLLRFIPDGRVHRRSAGAQFEENTHCCFGGQAKAGSGLAQVRALVRIWNLDDDVLGQLQEGCAYRVNGLLPRTRALR